MELRRQIMGRSSNWTQIKRIAPITISLSLISGGALSHPTPVAAKEKTWKLSKKLVGHAEELRKDLKEIKKQLHKTMDKYDNMLGKKDLESREKEYKNVKKELDETDKWVRRADKRAGTMEKDATEFFNKWTEGLDGLQDPELRALSEQRLAKTREGYLEIVRAGDKAADDYGAFLKSIRDEIQFLELDFSDDAVSALKSKDRDTKARVKQLSDSIDQVDKRTKNYIDSLK
jgi:exonuclease VII large subunit